MYKHTKWHPAAATLLLAAAVAVTGCAGTPEPSDGVSGSFKIIGSNTVTPLSSLWAEHFMKDHNGVSIAVSGPGSGVGIASLIDGTTDICQSSRPIKTAEIDQAKARGVNPYETQIATDALSVLVNPTNPVSDLTFAQISAIYTNKITNWKEVGGNDAPILVLSRDSNSGTFAYFLEEVVQMAGLTTKDTTLQYGGKVLLLPSTEEGVSQFAYNPNAIFYAGLGYINSSVKTLAIKKTATDTAVKPSVENALNGTYPVSRPLLYYTDGAPAGVIKTYIDYCLSGEGQQTVREAGFVPLPK